MKVYVAGMFSTIKQRKADAERLRAAGINVTSRWIDETVPHTVEVRDVPDQYLLETAIADLEDIDAADAVIFFVPTDEQLVDATLRSSSRGGRHVEFGYALGKKPIYVVGIKENVFHHFPTGVEHFGSFNELIATLRKRLGDPIYE